MTFAPLNNMYNLDSVIKKRLNLEQLKQFNKIYYGREDHCELKLLETTIKAGERNNFEVAAYSFGAVKEEVRKPNTVRLGLIQNSIVLPTNIPVCEQRQAIYDKIEQVITVAASENVRIICLQEAWSMPFFLCTKEKEKWAEFAESATHGPSTLFLSKLARKHEIVIVSPILEKDEYGVWWNTAVVIDEKGNYIGKHRKNHLPSVGSFSETTYYAPGNTGHPVFETTYGKIAVNICYGRHQALNWLMFALNGAQIVFNPSATIAEFGETFWGIEARNAAIANSYFTCSINRVGIEEFYVQNENKIRTYYGSSYVTAPDGSRTPGLSKNKDGLLIVETDLNLCRQMRDKWNFNMTVRLDMYEKSLAQFKIQ
ncbi:beta-ureidopropionase-like [Pararge aegeria]|uniref:beta-ureidopropionase-like n=1 Tax=Pararge aegeria TaxID=116150 RepID=UPI0019D1784F|nr:beta-ureidopropionase-like [Pararge aegeria]